MSTARILMAALGAAAASIVAVPAGAGAQDTSVCICPHPGSTSGRGGPSEFALRSSGSIAFTQGRPVGALRDNIGFGYGATGAYLFRLDRRGVLSLRGDIGILGYGNESFRVPLSSTIGGRIRVTVRTTNYVVPMSIGPQLTIPLGRVRPYVNAGIGTQFFFTESSVDGNDEIDDIASTTNQSDWTSAWVAGGGIAIPVSRRSSRIMVDVGAQYYAGGRARYLRPGSIQDLPGGETLITPLESDTHLLLVRLGVRIGL